MRKDWPVNHRRSSSPCPIAARWRWRSFPSRTQSPTPPGASVESRCTYARGPPSPSSVPLQSGTPSVLLKRGKSVPVDGGSAQRWLFAAVSERIPQATCSPTWRGLGFDKHPTLILLRAGHPATCGGSYSRNGQTCSSRTGRTGLLIESSSWRFVGIWFCCKFCDGGLRRRAIYLPTLADVDAEFEQFAADARWARRVDGFGCPRPRGC